jgi:hypothetical protein
MVPNLDFFAARPDLDALLDFVFDETECQVFESYSTPGHPLVKFASTAEVLHMFDSSGGVHLGLMLYADAMKGRYRIRRFDLKRELFPDTPWRETVEGWGLIQLELNGVRNGRLEHCHTNHNSEARALKWEATYPDFPPVQEWDFGAVSRISSRINRHVRTRLAVAKVGSRPLLAGAQAFFATGAVKPGP